MAARAKKTSSTRRTTRQPARKSKKPKGSADQATTQSMTPPSERRARLGTKYSCFSCGAKFYDLNKPEPLCPKCGADQRERPVESEAPAPQPPAPTRRPPPRPMASLLEDEEEVSGPAYEEDLDLGIGALDDEDEIFTGDDLEVGDDEEFED